MVRIKHRYILFTILYPSPSPSAESLSIVHPTDGPSPTATSPAYILFQRPSPSHVTGQLMTGAIRSSIRTLYGDHGASVTQSALRLVYFSPRTSTGILRVPRAHFRLVWASLTFLTRLPGSEDPQGAARGGRGGGRGARGRGGGRQRYGNAQGHGHGHGHGQVGTGSGTGTGSDSVACVVRVVRVSGTIRKSEEELLRRARMEVVRAKRDGTLVKDEYDEDRDDNSGQEGRGTGQNVLDRVFGQPSARGKGKGQGNGRETARNPAGQAKLVTLAGAEDDGIVDFDDDDDDAYDDDDDYDMDDMS